jgi:hypothetical protein
VTGTQAAAIITVKIFIEQNEVFILRFTVKIVLMAVQFAVVVFIEFE